MVKSVGSSHFSNSRDAKMQRSKVTKSVKARGAAGGRINSIDSSVTTTPAGLPGEAQPTTTTTTTTTGARASVASQPDTNKHTMTSTKKRKRTKPTTSGGGPTSGRTPKRTKEKPAQFAHPRLQAEHRRLGRAWLSPGDPLFESALEQSYKGMRHVPRASLPRAVHKGFRRSFDALHDAGLFLYDTVQAGGKRLSRTFVTRTLLGDPGITYKYLGLRLFAHPWDGAGDFRKGPGDGLANALGDPCLADLFSTTAAVTAAAAAEVVAGDASAIEGSKGTEVGDTLRKVGDLSEWMRVRAAALLEEEGKGGRQGSATMPAAEGGGSCGFNLTLINRMECSAAKRDLKPDPLFAMGKCSVSWHADSCLEDFSTIGVYHCTDPVSTDADWGIALRVSEEAKGSGDVAGGDAASTAELGRGRGRESAAVVATAVVSEREEAKEEKEVSTPPLLIPLQSGDAYFLLDDFNHFHEHAVVSGSSTLRYSSTHRVAATEGNTFSHVQRRCEEVLEGGGVVGGDVTMDARQILNVAQVRAEQALLTELESEWLNQFWVQGRRHAVLHPWWKGPMALVLATWRELERRTAVTVRSLLSLQRGQGQEGAAAGAPRQAEPMAEPAAVARAFDTVLRALEERRESRSRWDLRFADSAYRSLPPDCAPVVPEALWSCSGGGAAGGGAWEQEEGGTLPKALRGVICRVRECYSEAYRAACGGKKAGSAKAIAAGAASNWELFQQSASETKKPQQKKQPRERRRQQQQQQQQLVVHGGGGGGGRGRKGSRKSGGDGGGGGRGQRAGSQSGKKRR